MPRLATQNAIQQKLFKHSLHWQVNAETVEIGSNWADLTVAATLMGGSAYKTYGLGNNPRVIGPIYPPMGLRASYPLINRKFGQFTVAFVIGDPQARPGAWGPFLDQLRMYMATGRLHPNKPARAQALDQLVEIALMYHERAMEKYGEGLWLPDETQASEAKDAQPVQEIFQSWR